MRLDHIIKADARSVLNSKASVDWGCDYDYWVSISCKGEDDIFMQGDDARDFLGEMEKISKRCKALDEYTIALALAKPYIECIWA